VHSVRDGKWKMENGKWKMENGKWKMENGKWKIVGANYVGEFIRRYSPK
jgi:hypothetical protein